MRRTQIYLDEEQSRRLDRLAKQAGRTRSDVIRAAVDSYLDAPDSETEWTERWSAAVDASAGSAPSLPSGADYVADLRATDRERDEELEHRRNA